jgi:O-methyltransferase
MKSRAAVREALPSASDLKQPWTYVVGHRLYRMLFTDDLTMLPARRGRALYRLARQVERDGVLGDLVDCGVWNGGSTALLSAGAPSRRVWAFDSFEGLPAPGPLDGPQSEGRAGTLRGSPERVREAVARYGNDAGLRIVMGWFENTFPAAKEEIETIAVLHVDSDWFASVFLTLETFYERVSAGGYVVIDDYGGWEGARAAADDFRSRRGIVAPLEAVDDSGRFWRKPAEPGGLV